MKQWQFTKSGSPRDVLTMIEVPIPITCADDEVLVRLSHVSLNSAIMYRLIAYYGVLDPIGALTARPCVPEMDFSGIVCDLRGKRVKEFDTGDINLSRHAFSSAVFFSFKVIEYLESVLPDSQMLAEGCCGNMSLSNSIMYTKCRKISP